MKTLSKNKQIAIVIGLVLVVALSIFFFSGSLKLGNNNSLSIIGQSTVNTINGKAYYLFSATADSIDEGASFTLVGSNYTLTDGSNKLISPQTSATITFSKQDSNCVYPIQATSKSVCFGIANIGYYILGNPIRVSDILFTDNNGNSAILNGALNGAPKTITSSNGGTLQIKTIGLISSPSDCPNYEEVAIITNSGNQNKIVNRGQYEINLNNIAGANCLNPFNLFDYAFGQINEDTQFTSSFKTYPTLNGNTMSLTGDINIGSGLFTITANQNYFNSIIYTPPTQAKPRISPSDINVPALKKLTSGTAQVTVHNDASTSGVVLVTSTSSNSGISPTSTTITLPASGSQSLGFTITAGSTIGSGAGQICFTACPTSQFDSNSCSSACQNFDVTQNGPVYCPDGICESWENNATCPQDCYKPNCPPSCNSDLDCTPCGNYICSQNKCIPNQPVGTCKSCVEWATSLFKPAESKCIAAGSTVTWWNPLTYLNGTGLFSQNLWCPILFLIVAIVGIFSFLFLLQFLEKFDFMQGENKKIIRLIISAIIALVLAYLTYQLFWVGIICFIIFIIIRFAINIFLPTQFLRR